MQIKQILKESLQKTKNVLNRLKSTLTVKRFSLVTLIVVVVLSSSLSTCNVRSPTSANAQAIDGDYIIVTPSVRTKYRYGTNADSYVIGTTIQSMYITFDSDYIPNAVYNFTMPSENVNYTYSKYVFSSTGTVNSLPAYQVNFQLYLLFVRQRSDGSIDYNALTTSYSLTFTFVVRSEDYTDFVPSYIVVSEAYSGFILNDYVQNNSYDGIKYSYYALDDTLLYEIYLTYNNNRGFSFNTDNFTAVFLDVTSSFGEDGAYLYNSGYNAGYTDGLTAGSSGVTPFSMLLSSVDAFLSIELFPNFEISTLLKIAFSLIFLGIAIKVFMGG